MRNITALLSFLTVLLIAAGCQTDTGDSSSTGDAFVGGTSALKMSFVENSPPLEVVDEDTFSFAATVTIENVGETDINEKQLVVKLGGFYPGDFGVTNPQTQLRTELPASGKFRGVQKDPDGNKIQGDIAQPDFPIGDDFFAYNERLEGNQLFPFRAEACYPYTTKVLSQVCLMEDLTKKEHTVCSPTGSRPVSNSGAPIHVTSVTQSVGGKNRLLLKFDVKKVGSSDIFKITDEKCKDDFKLKNRLQVDVTTNIGPENQDLLSCVGLINGDYNVGGYGGELLLSDGSASFTCIQTLPDSIDSDIVKTFDVLLTYLARDSVSTNVLVKHVISGS